MPHAAVNGISFHYTDEGPRDAPALVLGHGLLFSGWMFHPQVAALKDRFRCITVDWRGQGETPEAPDGKADMDSLTDDLVALLDHLGLDAVHYGGLSMGGFVGMRLAARHPERVLSLILLDTSAGPEDPEKVSQYRLLAKVYRVLGIAPVRGKVEPLMFSPTVVASGASKAIADEWMGMLKKVPRSGMTKAIRGVTDRLPVVDEIGSITAPTLVIVGADDTATPLAKAEVIASTIPGAQLKVVPDAGHSSTIEQPEAVSRLMSDFLASLPG